MPASKIILKTKKDQSLRRKHPWVFSGAIKKTEGPLYEGAVVDVVSNHGEYLGTGHYQVGSIAVKIFTFDHEEANAELWKKRIQQAFELRQKAGLVDNPNTNVYRLIHAEGDHLPGLIADFYNGTLVLQTPSIGMHLMKDELVTAFREVMGDRLKSIYDKSEGMIPKEANIELENGYLWGEKVGQREVLEHGCKFMVNWETGQKTGFFIDQRENRKLLGAFANGKSVLNTFCYSGGFSIYGIQQGSTLMHSLDSSQKALDLVDENIEVNHMQDAEHACIKADATEHIKNMDQAYDIIILDPPAFAKHQKARHNAVQGYKRLNANAMKHIKPGGLLFTFSCSQAVDKSLFNHTITAAAIQSGRKARILHQLHQPADHPINIYHPEGEYLKGLVVQID